MAGNNTKKNTFGNPSFDHSLSLLCELVESNTLSSEERDPQLLEFVREFKTVKSFKWKALITKGATTTTTLTEKNWNALPILSFTEDVKKLEFHMENNRIIIEKNVETSCL